MQYKILIVDDDREMLKMLKSFFEIKRYFIVTAEDGMEARIIELFEKTEYSYLMLSHTTQKAIFMNKRYPIMDLLRWRNVDVGLENKIKRTSREEFQFEKISGKFEECIKEIYPDKNKLHEFIYNIMPSLRDSWVLDYSKCKSLFKK